MVPHNRAGELFRCPNCDVLQPQEVGERRKPRVATREDRLFGAAWERKKREIYGPGA